MDANQFILKYMIGMTLEPKYLKKIKIDIPKEKLSIIHHLGKINEEDRKKLIIDTFEELKEIFESNNFKDNLSNEISRNLKNSDIAETLIDELYHISSAEHRNKKYLEILNILRRGKLEFKKQIEKKDIKKGLPVLYAVLKALNFI